MSGSSVLRADARRSQMPRIRVAHLIYRLQEGGMERGVLKIVNGLHGGPIESAIYSSQPATSLRELVDPSVPVVEFRRRRGNDPAFVWRLYQHLKRAQPHILHTHAWGTLCEGLIAARLAGIPAVIHGEHGTLQTRTYQLWVQRRAWARTDRLLAVSSCLADRIAAVVDVPRDGIQVIRNGVDADRFKAPKRSEARLSLGIPADVLAVGAVGRLVDVKDHRTLLDACAILVSQSIRFRCLIAGEGPLRRALEAQITGLGLNRHVQLLGHRHDIERVLAGLDILVLTSKSEGLPNTILEAMAAGIAVVSTRNGGADELIEDGRSGVLIEPQSPTALARALAALERDRECRAQIAAAGRSRAEREFSLQSMVAAYERLYLEVAREHALVPEMAEPLHAAAGS